MKKSKTAPDLTTRPLLKKTILFTLPLLLASVLQLLYNSADIIVLGQWAENSESAVAAVGSTGALVGLVTNLFIGLSVGALALAARYVGAKDDEKLADTVHTAVLMSVIGGFAVGIIGFCLSTTLLKLTDTPDSVLPLSSLYLKIYFCGMPFNLLYNFGASLLRANGDTKRPFVVLASAGVVNVALNILMVAGFKMGVAGVGIATTVSQAVSAVGVVILLMRRKDAAKLVLKKLRIHKKAMIDMVKIGLPAGIQGTVFSLSNVIIQSSINGFDEIAMAGNATAANIEGFVYVSMNSIAQACLTVAGQNYGAAKPENIDLSLVQCLSLVTGVGIVMGVGAYLLGTPLLRLYGCSGEAIAYGKQRMSVICTMYALCGIMEVFVSILRALGRSTMPMIVSIVGVVGVRLLWIITVFRAYHTLTVLYISYVVSWTFTLLIHMCCYLFVRKKEFVKLREARARMQEEQAEAAASAASETVTAEEIIEETVVENTQTETPETPTENA